MAKKAATSPHEVPLPPDVDDLREFWRSVMKGNYVTAIDGKPTTVAVPMELRLKASELLAKFTVPTPKGKPVGAAGPDVTATPDILRVAKLLEDSQDITDKDLGDVIDG